MANYQLEYTGNQVAAILASVVDKLDTADFEAFQTALTALLAQKAPLASPALTGTPTVPTAAVSTNTTQAASTAFVLGQKGTASPMMDGTAAVGSSLLYARQDHVHPSDASRAALASPAFTGTPTAPTAAVGTNSTQLATTAFVLAQIAASLGFKVYHGTATLSSSSGTYYLSFPTTFSTIPFACAKMRQSSSNNNWAYGGFVNNADISTSYINFRGLLDTGTAFANAANYVIDWVVIGT